MFNPSAIPDEKALKWVQECITLCRPDQVHVCNGDEEEKEELTRRLLKSGTFVALNNDKRPNSYLARSSPEDVARVEEDTFICSLSQEDAGPTNNWRSPQEMKMRLSTLFQGCMKGRTLYVVPFVMGPINSSFSKGGIQITDSPYVALSMGLMTRMGKETWAMIKQSGFVPCLHSVGKPLEEGENDVPWPCNPQNRVIAHFPEERAIWSFGSGYGGNALLGKKSFALRIASVMGRDEGWLAEHMLILGITNPEGEKKYIAAAFPSACGKTNLAMLKPTLPGWKIETVGDDIAWIRFDSEGRLRAINPESGFFGVAPGTSLKTNFYAMQTIKENTLFTNVALTDEGDVWWEGMTETPPAHLINWLGHDWTPQSSEKAAHPNSRFTASIRQCPCIDPLWESPEGVPLSAILFGGRRSTVMPLVVESFDWAHGVFLGATLTSEMTAAAKGKVGELRHDPFAMLPFCGYNMGDYFAHWLQMGQKKEAHLPKIFYVNWFRKNAEGKFIWPGFGDNCRVLKWIVERVEGKVEARSSPLGLLPHVNDLDVSGLALSEDSLQNLFSFSSEEWHHEMSDISGYFSRFGSHLPEGMKAQTTSLEQRIHSSLA